MRPFVLLCGSPMYQLSKYSTAILQPLNDTSRRKPQSTENFINPIKTVHDDDDDDDDDGGGGGGGGGGDDDDDDDDESLFTSIPLLLALQCTATAMEQSTVKLTLPTEVNMDILSEPLPYIDLLSVQLLDLQLLCDLF